MSLIKFESATALRLYGLNTADIKTFAFKILYENREITFIEKYINIVLLFLCRAELVTFVTWLCISTRNFARTVSSRSNRIYLGNRLSFTYHEIDSEIYCFRLVAALNWWNTKRNRHVGLTILAALEKLSICYATREFIKGKNFGYTFHYYRRN